jgi:hypothetical protein
MALTKWQSALQRRKWLKHAIGLSSRKESSSVVSSIRIQCVFSALLAAVRLVLSIMTMATTTTSVLQPPHFLQRGPPADILLQKRSAANEKVMVLSWLTATNNNRRFIFSLNRRRHSSSLLKSSLSPSSSCSSEFTLSVPVQGTEELVRSVGSVSGQFGSKFPADYKDVLMVGSTAASLYPVPQ